MMKKIMMLMILFFPVVCLSQETANYLILNDIGEYKFRPKRMTETYGNSGVLIPADHFDMDHNDTIYGARYVHPVTILGVEVQVTCHTDPNDSLRWLLHEVDKEFRTYYGIPDPSYIIKTIDGNTIYTFGSAGWDYRWISGNKIIMIEYHDTQMEKPEPLEVVRAYLAKHPSTLPTITMKELYSNSNKISWIKDEMDRRLWLCDKWFMQLQLKKAEEKQVYQQSAKSMNIFLDYREKYYGIKAVDEKNLLAGYLSANNGTGIKAKLTEYRNWWSVNKEKAISL
jgi:hypothetical protein